MAIKSPFYVAQDFISPLTCEEIVDGCKWMHPDTNLDGVPVKTIKSHQLSEDILFKHFEELSYTLEEYFGFEYRGTERMMFEWHSQGSEGEKTHCESHALDKGKWIKVRDRDITCVLFLSDYQERTPFDSDFEVYGGKLEFISHRFGFNPQRGTIIAFPSGPNFINGTSAIRAGDLFQVRIHIAAKQQYQYNPRNFPGNYSNWFDTIA